MALSGFNNIEFLLGVSGGNEIGYSAVRKFGNNPDIDSLSGFEDIAECCPNYAYPTTAATNYISSSNVGDSNEITVIGLDAEWNKQVVTQSLEGQTKIEIGSGKEWIRVYRIFNSGGTDLLGDAYVYEDDTITNGVPDTAIKVKAKIQIGNNQSLMAIYTVPAGKTGYIRQLEAAISSKKDSKSVVKLFTREFGKVFRVKDIFSLQRTGNSCIARDYVTYIKCEEKTDIKVSADTDTNDIGVSASFSLILVNN